MSKKLKMLTLSLLLAGIMVVVFAGAVFAADGEGRQGNGSCACECTCECDCECTCECTGECLGENHQHQYQNQHQHQYQYQKGQDIGD